jgi:hypothetical protein
LFFSLFQLNGPTFFAEGFGKPMMDFKECAARVNGGQKADFNRSALRPS